MPSEGERPVRKIVLAGSIVLAFVLFTFLATSYGPHLGPSSALGGPAPCWSLQVSADPPTEGSVDVSPPPNCDGLYTDETAITLTAQPEPGHNFYYWEGD